jgi:hypothetical protein
LPDARGSVQGYADAGANVDAAYVLGKRIIEQSGTGTDTRINVGVSTPAIRAFARAVNEGSIDIQALQASVSAFATQLFGVGQTWQDLTASRVSGTQYTNSTPKAIQVLVKCGNLTSQSMVIVVGGVTIFNATTTLAGGNNNQITQSFIVPPGSTYTVTLTASYTWAELR